MKVKELIKQLQLFDPEDEVFVSNYGDDTCGMYEYEPTRAEARTNIFRATRGSNISNVLR